MHILFVHQNFPAQFRYIATRLAAEHGWTISFATERQEDELPGIRKIIYKPRGGATLNNHTCTRNFENAVAHAHGVYEALKLVPEVQPDLVIAHTGFGSSLFLPYLYDAPIINFLEFFYHPVGQDMGFRPELPVSEVDLLRIKTKNAMILLDVVNCDRGWCPTHYQRDYFPPELRSKIDVIFDGIDTSVFQRQSDGRARVEKAWNIPPDARIVTYVARGFERMRGFDIFMKIAARIAAARPDVVFLVVGTDKVYYGGDMNYTTAPSFRLQVLEDEPVDLSRFRFTGYVPQETLADILSASDLHLYLTEPFIASWSMVDAMACGAIVLASDQACVREYISPGENGLLNGFFDVDGFTEKSLSVLADPNRYAPLARAAMHTVQTKYSLDVALPRLKAFFESVAATRRHPSTLLSNLARTGTVRRVHSDPDMVSAIPAPTSPETTRPATTPPATELPPDSDPGRAAASAAVRSLLNSSRSLPDWITAAQTFSSPDLRFGRLGPDDHPADLVRLLNRFSQWKPRWVLDMGTTDGGLLFLLARIAADNAHIIAASLPDQPFPAEKIPFFNAMARPGQTIHCLSDIADHEALYQAVEKIIGPQRFDCIFLRGNRPLNEMRWDYRKYRSRLRPGGLLAWNAIQPVADPGPNQNGGDLLWKEVRPLFPQRAEYLEGCRSTTGGIAVIKL
jgi:glycosyltransferase involved in cell wall biosynthesis